MTTNKPITVWEFFVDPKNMKNFPSSIEHSISVYDRWAKNIHDFCCMNFKLSAKDKQKSKENFEKIGNILSDNYGPSRFITIDYVKKTENISLISINESIISQVLKLFNVNIGEEDHLESSIALLRQMCVFWYEYQDPFIKEVFGEGSLIMTINRDYLDIDPKNNNNFFQSIKKAWTKKLDPFQKDPITGKTFMQWILSLRLKFYNEAQREEFQTLVIKMLFNTNLNTPWKWEDENLGFINLKPIYWILYGTCNNMEKDISDFEIKIRDSEQNGSDFGTKSMRNESELLDELKNIPKNTEENKYIFKCPKNLLPTNMPNIHVWFAGNFATQHAKIIGWSPDLAQKIIKCLHLQNLYIENTIPMEIVGNIFYLSERNLLGIPIHFNLDDDPNHHRSLMEKLGEIFNGEGKDHIPYLP